MISPPVAIPADLVKAQHQAKHGTPAMIAPGHNAGSADVGDHRSLAEKGKDALRGAVDTVKTEVGAMAPKDEFGDTQVSDHTTPQPNTHAAAVQRAEHPRSS